MPGSNPLPERAIAGCYSSRWFAQPEAAPADSGKTVVEKRRLLAAIGTTLAALRRLSACFEAAETCSVSVDPILSLGWSVAPVAKQVAVGFVAATPDSRFAAAAAAAAAEFDPTGGDPVAGYPVCRMTRRRGPHTGSGAADRRTGTWIEEKQVAGGENYKCS